MANPGAQLPSSVVTDPARVAQGMSGPYPVPSGAAPTPTIDPLESAQGSIQLGTDGGFVSAQYTPTDIGDASRSRGSSVGLFMLVAVVTVGVVLGILVSLSSSWSEAEAEAPIVSEAAPVAPAAPRGPEPALDEGLRALALVNVRDPAQAQPFEQRHVLLEQVEAGPDATRIDRRLNVALDLLQAADSQAPCETFAGTLDVMEASADPYYQEVLDAARAPAASCAALDERRLALLASLQPDAETPELVATRSGKRGKGKHKRGKGKGKERSPASTPTSSRAVDEDSSSKNVGGKLDDGLRPFGK